jgi:hypothetical protein
MANVLLGLARLQIAQPTAEGPATKTPRTGSAKKAGSSAKQASTGKKASTAKKATPKAVSTGKLGAPGVTKTTSTKKAAGSTKAGGPKVSAAPNIKKAWKVSSMFAAKATDLAAALCPVFHGCSWPLLPLLPQPLLPALALALSAASFALVRRLLPR